MSGEKIVLRNFKLTEDENKRLKADAYRHGMNVTEYLKALIEKERDRVKSFQTEERNRELCRSNYAAQLEGLGYNADGTPKGSA